MEKQHKMVHDKAQAAMRLVQQTQTLYNNDVHHASAKVAAMLDLCNKMITVMDNNNNANNGKHKNNKNSAVSVLDREQQGMLDVIMSMPKGC